MGEYAALGDSYAAGVGAGTPQDSCGRAAGGYPVLVASALGTPLSYQACTGASIADVEHHQLGALGRRTRFVSITVGGNDLGFTDVMTEFALPSWVADDSVLDKALKIMHQELPGRYDVLFARVRAAAPRAQVVVTGYPRLFNGQDCSLLTFFSASEMARLNDAADQFAQVIEQSCAAAGLPFVDVRDAFAQHEICDPSPWIHDVVWPIDASFHPNAAGQLGYAARVGAAFGVSAVPAGTVRVGSSVASPLTGPSQRPVTVSDVAEAGSLDRQPVPITPGPCRTTEPPRFHIPDVGSARSLRAARRYGLDPDEIEGLSIRVKNPAGDRGAWERLRELDQWVTDRRR